MSTTAREVREMTIRLMGRIQTQRLLFALIMVVTGNIRAQKTTINGIVVDAIHKKGIEQVKVFIEGNSNSVYTSSSGSFQLGSDCLSNCILVFEKEGYTSLRLPLDRNIFSADLGVITLSRINPVEKRDVLLNLTESDLDEEEGVSDVVGFLQGSRDIFLNRAAFDFSQSFFRIRGYDSSEGQVQINGLPVNSLIDGRPQWNNWGGLNDVMRYATSSLNLDISRTSFEGLMGGIDFTIRPSQMRPGTRFTTSFSNRTYATRLMATHASGDRDGKMAYTCSLSRRWADQGYMQGTPYNAYSLFGSIELELGKYSTLYGFAMYAYNLRGRSAPITQEVYNLAGRTYNPYWGMQANRIRNARKTLI
ncbi:MAG: TonB-dependent receptor, partial [Eudoraea sp.]|nr:TonB-dependent receptor [Eudoraea sp.]